MRTLYTAAPFSRFDLGQHALGQQQPCPVGTLPMRYPNGAVVCAKASPGSGMFMAPSAGGNVGYGPAMGQIQDPYLTQTERDKLLAQIDEAVKKVKPLDDMIVWSMDNDPQLKNMLGSDHTRFWALSNSIAPLYKDVKSVGDRLKETDAEAWYRPDAEELASIKQWVTGVNEMYKILQAHQTPVTPHRLTSTPPPSIALAPTAATMPKGGALTSTGTSTTEYLVAGGVAIGLGTLLYALFG
jgi:hypothetical protein